MKRYALLIWAIIGISGTVDGFLSFIQRIGLVKIENMNELIPILKDITSISTPILVLYLTYLFYKEREYYNKLGENNKANDLMIGKLNDRCKSLVEQLRSKDIDIKIPKINLSTHEKNMLSSFNEENRSKIMNSQWDNSIYVHDQKTSLE